MKQGNNAIVLPFVSKKQSQAEQSLSDDMHIRAVLSGTFASDIERDEFVQAITSHGIMFLRSTSTPQSKPSDTDLSTIEKIAQSLRAIWLRSPNTEVQS